MGAVKLVLKKNKVIRGKEYAAGEVVMAGECPNGFTPHDIEKGIQAQDIRVLGDLVVPAPKQRKKTAEPDRE